VPLSALAGLGVAYGRRVARERGWVTART
jgi:hypothetical protein